MSEQRTAEPSAKKAWRRLSVIQRNVITRALGADGVIDPNVRASALQGLAEEGLVDNGRLTARGFHVAQNKPA